MSTSSPTGPTATMMSVGDIYVTRPDPLTVFGPVADLLRDADLLVGNVEGPISDRGEPLTGKAECGSMCLRSSLALADALADLGFSTVTLANNHTMDFGTAALEQTFDLLADRSIAAVGAGADLARARTPVVDHVGGTRVATLGYTTVFPPAGFAAADGRPGVATVRTDTAYRPPPGVHYQPGSPPIIVTVPDALESAAMVADVLAARSVADLVVVQFHWGVAGHPHPLGYMRDLAVKAIDAGADLVVGNHPHLLLGVEVHRGVPILYNLNHFAFDMHTPSWRGAEDAAVLRSTISDGRFVEHSLVMTTIDPASRNLSLSDRARVGAVHELLAELSADFGTLLERRDDEIVIVGAAEGTPPPPPPPLVYADVPRAQAAGARVVAAHTAAPSGDAVAVESDEAVPPTTDRIGVIGLGSMGEGMATNLVTKGFATVVRDLRTEPAERLRALGAEVAGSNADVGRRCDIVMVVVFTDQQIRDTLLPTDGDEGLLAAMRPGSVVCINSTVSPTTVQAMAAAAADRGVTVADVAMSGSPDIARAGALTFMFGGDEAALERCAPALRAMSGTLHHVGPLGAGITAKIINNLLAATNASSVREALTLSRALGFDDTAILSIVATGLGSSWMSDNWPRMREQEALHSQGSGGFAAMAGKDLQLAADLGHETATPMPLLEFVLQDILPDIEHRGLTGGGGVGSR